MRVSVSYLVGLAVTLVLLAACGSKPAAALPQSPEEAIDQFTAHLNAGEYGKASTLYHNGPEMWERDPALWKSIIEDQTQGAKIVRFEPIDSIRKPDAVTITGWLHREGKGPRQVWFEFVKRPTGWIIVSFR